MSRLAFFSWSKVTVTLYPDVLESLLIILDKNESGKFTLTGLGRDAGKVWDETICGCVIVTEEDLQLGKLVSSVTTTADGELSATNSPPSGELV